MRQQPRVTQPSLLYAVKQVELAVRAHLDDLLRHSGVTTVQFTAMTVLRQRDGMTSAELARNSFVTTQSMADIVFALERAGLIDRQRDPTDGRRMLIRLSAAGEELLTRYDRPVADLEHRMVRTLDAPQREAFRHALNSARAALSDPEP